MNGSLMLTPDEAEEMEDDEDDEITFKTTESESVEVEAADKEADSAIQKENDAAPAVKYVYSPSHRVLF